MCFLSRKISIILGALIFIGYIAWSQIELAKKRSIIESQQTRLYNIADNFELWKKIATEHKGKLNIELLAQDSRNIEIFKIEREELNLDSDSHLYIMFYDAPNKTRKEKLDKYFSDLVLGNYFSIITNSDGQIKYLFWDKP